MERKVFILACALLFVPQMACCDGMMVPSQSAWKAQRERALINEPEQKAVVYFENGQEQLIISPSYQGRSENFAWVVPVPNRPQVKIIHGELFHELARIVQPKPPLTGGLSGATGGGIAAAPVELLERKTVGAYDVSVLAASDSNALKRWLDQNGYVLPEAAQQAMTGYVEEKWTFVACRIKLPQRTSGLQKGVLAPLCLTFATQQPVYPMRLSTINPAPFDLLLYLILPERESLLQSLASVRLTGWPGHPLSISDRGSRPLDRFLAVDGRSEDTPTLAALHAGRLRMFWIDTKIAPADCTSDYVWSVRHKRSEWFYVLAGLALLASIALVQLAIRKKQV